MTRKSLPPLSITIRVMNAKDEPATTSQIVQNNCQKRIRLLLYPTVAWTRQGNAWFFTARTGLHFTHYDLDAPLAADTPHIDRTLPITSIDSEAGSAANSPAPNGRNAKPRGVGSVGAKRAKSPKNSAKTSP